MDFTAFLQSVQQSTETFTSADVLLTLILSFVLSLLIGYTYQATYRGSSYSQSYVHTLVLMSMVVGMIMLVIGSNIARAFSLVGALSIVRFRNAVKDTRDVGFIFFAMAVGMACGTRFYLVAILTTVIVCFLLWGMVRLDLFARQNNEQILKIRMPADMAAETIFNELFDRYFRHYSLVTVETAQAGTLVELVYSVESSAPFDVQQLFEEIRQRNGNNKVVLIKGQQEIDL